MISEPKTLVILDTNKIRNNFEWEKDYSNFEPKGDFLKIIDWISNSRLQNLVFVGLPEIVVEELVITRCQNFDKEVSELKLSLKKLENVPCFDFSKINLPQDSFDYRGFIDKKILDYTEKKESVIFLKLEETFYAATLNSLMKKAIHKRKPFSDSGKGFKDALIWEIILNFQDIDGYSNVFLLTENQKDFDLDLQEEFQKKFSKDLNLETDTNALIVSLENIYGSYVKYPSLLSYLKTDYFKSKLIEYFVKTYDWKIKEFTVKTILQIREVTPKDLEEFELSDTYSQDDLPTLKIVNLLFENDNHKFDTSLIIEPETNEIIELIYEDVQ